MLMKSEVVQGQMKTAEEPTPSPTSVCLSLPLVWRFFCSLDQRPNLLSQSERLICAVSNNLDGVIPLG